METRATDGDTCVGGPPAGEGEYSSLPDPHNVGRLACEPAQQAEAVAARGPQANQLFHSALPDAADVTWRGSDIRSAARPPGRSQRRVRC